MGKHNPYMAAADALARKLAPGFATAGRKLPSLDEGKELLRAEEERQREEAREYGARRLIAHAQTAKTVREERERRKAGRGARAQGVTKASRGR